MLIHLIAHRRPVSERGASVVEYALLIGLIALMVIGSVNFIGNSVAGGLDEMGSSL